MPNEFIDDGSGAVSTAQAISEASETEVSQIFLRLRASKRLFSTILELNKMLSNSGHSSLALRALKRLGLEYAG